jgi:hypothetical protein
MAPSVGNRGCPRWGVGELMEMVSFLAEEGWSNLRGFTGANPICDGGGWIKYRLEYSFNNYPPPALLATSSLGGHLFTRSPLRKTMSYVGEFTNSTQIWSNKPPATKIGNYFDIVL